MQGLGQGSEEALEAELAASDEETGAGQVGAESAADGPENGSGDLDAGAGTGDAVPETEASSADGRD